MPIMPQYRSPYGQSIAELLMRQGDAAARAAERSGMLWGNAVQNLGQIGAQAYEQHQQQKDQKQRELILDDALTTFDPMNPGASYRKLATAIGPEHATRAMSTMVSLYKMQQGEQPDPKMVVSGLAALEEKAPGYIEKNWATAGPALAPVASMLKLQLDPTKPPEGFGQQLLAINSAWNPQRAASASAPDRMEQNGIVYERQQDGKWAPALGLPEEKPEVKPDARSLDARYAEAVATGNQAEAQTLLAAKARLEAAGRAPTSADTGTWEEAVGPDGPILFNRKTGQTKAYPEGVKPKPTGRQALAQGERTQFSSINYVYPKLDGFISFVQQNPDLYGKFDAKKTSLKQMFPGFVDADFSSKQAFIGRVNAEIRKAMFGTALSATEKATADTFLINDDDQPEKIIAKVQAAKERMASDVDYYRGLGYNVGSVNTGAGPKAPAGGGKPPATSADKDALLKKYGFTGPK